MKRIYLLMILNLIALTFFSCKDVNIDYSIRGNDPKDKAIDIANLDLSVNPGDDFFLYSNGSWIENNPIPDEYSRYGSFNLLRESVADNLKVLLDEAAVSSGSEKGSALQQIGDFYSSGMDTANIEKAGLSGLQDELDLIDDIKTVEDVQVEIARLHTMSIVPLFIIYAGQDAKNSDLVITQLHQGGLGLADRDYYLEDDDRSKEIRAAYVKHIAKMFVLLGEDAKTSQENAQQIFALEKKLAESSLSRLENRDPNKTYNKVDLTQLTEMAPDFNWVSYFSAIGVEARDINVAQPGFFKSASALLSSCPAEIWKTYLKWNLINSTAEYLTGDFEKANFDFYGTVLSGSTRMQDRWKRVLGTTNEALGEALGQIFVKKHFPPEAKERMANLVANIKVSINERIINLDWMSEQTKIKAQDKLLAMNLKIGYPDQWMDYSSIDITRESYVINALRSRLFNFNKEMAKINKAVDRGEWHMSPQTVNAYYSPTMNEIVFPAGILQPPFFYLDGDDAVNYGAIGAVIGHEMTHGFDDKGRLFDKEGNLNNWWTEEDSVNFEAKTKVLVEHYNNFTILDSLHVDGNLTLGENIADLGGVTASLQALKRVLNGKEVELINGFTPIQRFFLSYSHVWSQNIRDKEQMRRLKEDVHSPGVARVNGIVSIVAEFYEAFDVNPENKLYLEVENRAKIW